MLLFKEKLSFTQTLTQQKVEKGGAKLVHRQSEAISVFLLSSLSWQESSVAMPTL